MNVTLVVRLDTTDDGDFVWWAESPEILGFSAAANTLREMRFAAESILREDSPTAHITYVLADDRTSGDPLADIPPSPSDFEMVA